MPDKKTVSPAVESGSKALRRVGGKPVTSSKQSGVALDMGNGGRDAEDDEFERY